MPVHWSLGRQHFEKLHHTVSCNYVEDVEYVVLGSDENADADSLVGQAMNAFKDIEGELANSTRTEGALIRTRMFLCRAEKVL